MPEKNYAGAKILKFLNENDISVASLATKYEIPRAELAKYLNSDSVPPKGHAVMLRIIEDHKIR